MDFNVKFRCTGPALSCRSQRGLTLVELLVVCIVIGVLGSLAIPAFATQRSKGRDACAKQQVITARTALEIYATDRTNGYTASTLTLLRAYDTSLPASATGGCTGSSTYALGGTAAANATCSSTPNATRYCIRITSSSQNRFNLARVANGTITRRCWVIPGNPRGGCPNSNAW